VSGFLGAYRPNNDHMTDSALGRVRAQIEAYEPVSEQEAQDQTTILKFIDDFPDILTRDNIYAHITASSWIVNPS
jgi:hypothetical protein